MKSINEANPCRWFEQLNKRNALFSGRTCNYLRAGMDEIVSTQSADMFTSELRDCPI